MTLIELGAGGDDRGVVEPPPSLPSGRAGRGEVFAAGAKLRRVGPAVTARVSS